MEKNAILISDLDDYETEAIDILFLVEKRYSINKVEKIIREVIEEAFSFRVEINDYSEITDLVMVLKNEF